MPLAALLLFETTHERSLAYVVTVGLGMLCGAALLLLASLDAHEEKSVDGPIRDAAPEVYDGD